MDRVLIAGESPELGELEKRLSSQGLSLHRVTDGAAALRSALEQPPDIIVAGVEDPSSLLTGLNQNQSTAAIPVILISPYTDEESRISELMAGATDSIRSPFHVEELRARIESHLRLQRVRRRTEESLRASEAKFSTAFGYSPLALTITRTSDGRLVEVNERFVQISGYSREEAIGRTPDELGLWVAPDVRAERFKRLMAGESVPSVEAQFRIKSGELIIGMIGSALVQIDGQLCVLSSVTDITEQKRSQGNTSFLAEVSQDLTRNSDPDEVLSEVSKKIAAQLNLSRVCFSEVDASAGNMEFHFDWSEPALESLSGVKALSDLIDEGTHQQLLAGRVVRLQGNNERWGNGALLHAPHLNHGSLKFVLSCLRSVPTEWREDETELVCELCTRISLFMERAATERKLRLSEERFRLLTENATEYAIIFMDPDRKITSWNIGAERILGWEESEILGKSGDIIFLPEHQERGDPETEVQNAIVHGRTANERWHVRKDGSQFFGSGQLIALYDEADRLRGFAKMFRDLTEHKQEENRLALVAEISELTRTHTVVDDLLYSVCSTVGRYLNVSRCLFNEIDTDKDVETVHPDYHSGVPSVEGIHRVSEYSSTTSAEIQTGKTIINNDSSLDSRTAQDYERIYAPSQERAYVAVPVFRDNHWVGSLWVSDNKPRHWTKKEVALIEETAERTWWAVQRLRIDSALRESEERFRQAADAANALVYEIHLTKDQTAVVYGMERVVGYSPDEVVLTSGWWHSLIHPDDLPDHLSQLGVHLNRGGKYVSEYRVRRKDGVYINVQDNGIVILDTRGQGDRLIGAITDITDRKRWEESLHESQRQLRAALAAAEEAGRMKDEFLATVSHELRTPLNAILGWAHLLQMKPVDPAMATTALEAIYTSAKNQAQIIDDLLDVARIVSGKMTLQPQKIVLAEVLSEAISTLVHAITAKGIRMDVQFAKGSEFISFYADPHRLQQVFWNLLANAVKFTPPGGTIEIRVEQDSSEVSVTFKDSGIGIPAEFLPVMFDRFRQADSSTTRKFGGLGLGLSITRHLVELHGGSVSAASEGPGKGSIFSVRIPLLQVLADATLTSPGYQTAVSDPFLYSMEFPGSRILLVDDDANTLRLIRQTFEDSGAELRTTTSAAEALEIYKQWGPDLLISDIAMPDQDGYWLIQQIRALNGTTVPAIALTAYASAADRAKVLASGFQRFVAKPVEPGELLATAKSLLQTRQQQPESTPDPGAKNGSGLHGKKVLLVEDDLVTTEMLRLSLERQGMLFRSASRASDALNIVNDWMPDLIISDLGLPGEDGYQLIQKIRALPSSRQAEMPAIALTGYGKDEGLRAIAAGFHIYKTKPVEPTVLIELVSELVEK